MRIAVFRWQGYIDAALADRISEASGVPVQVLTVGKFHYLCLSTPSDRYVDVQPQVEAVRKACDAEDRTCKSHYFLVAGFETMTELDYIQVLEYQKASLAADLAGARKVLATSRHP